MLLARPPSLQQLVYISRFSIKSGLYQQLADACHLALVSLFPRRDVKRLKFGSD